MTNIKADTPPYITIQTGASFVKHKANPWTYLFSPCNFSKVFWHHFYNYIDSSALSPINVEALLSKFRVSSLNGKPPNSK